jgi:hypothetical protein
MDTHLIKIVTILITLVEKMGVLFIPKKSKTFRSSLLWTNPKEIIHNSDNFYRARIARSTCLE